VAVPLTNAVGWRVSTGSWALLAIIAVIPWLFIQKGVQPNPEEQGRTKLPVGRWSVAWAIMIVFSIGAFNSFAMLAWLPEILTKSFNIAQADSGRLMSMFSFIGFFPTIFVPIVLTRFKKPWFVVLFFSLCIIIANLGFLFLPQFAVIWIAAAGTGLTFISVGLTLINLRSRTKFGSASLSGFVQGGGYLLSALGPVTVGWLHELTGGWAASLWLLAGTGVLALVMGLLALKPVYLEDYAKETIG
jgi:CP family cyanate transporter-like MFS transporter